MKNNNIIKKVLSCRKDYNKYNLYLHILNKDL